MLETIKNISKTNFVAAANGVTFGDVIYNPDGFCGPRVQQDYQMVLIIEGDLELQAGDRHFAVPAGYFVLCEPGYLEVFQFSPTACTRHQWCAVHPRLADPALAARLKGSAGVASISETLQELVRLGLGRSLALPAENDLLFPHLGRAVLETCLADRAADSRDLDRKVVPLQRARQTLHEHYTGEWTLDALARRAGVSANHLIKLFREHLDITPMEYLWQIRLDHAAVLLRKTGLGIAEIGYQTGFQNPFHFSRRFRLRFHQSPRAYREEGNVTGTEKEAFDNQRG